MGLMSLFGRGPLSDKKIAKIAKLACNPFAQPDVRMREMHRLLEEGTPLALRNVLKRFAVNASGNIADEDEKKYLEESIVTVGESAIEPLRSYIKSEAQLTYALRSYTQLTSAEEATRFFIEILAYHGPDDHRGLEAKLQLIWQLADELARPEVLPALCPHLLDHGDDIRWAVMDLLERAEDEGILSSEVREQAAAELAEVVTTDEAAPRILKRAAALLCDREWALPGSAEALTSDLDDDYFLDKKRFVRKRVRRSGS